MNTPRQATINLDDLQHILESLIRKIIREELEKVTQRVPSTFFLDPEAPLYEDMKNILRRKTKKEVELFSHDEVWNE